MIRSAASHSHQGLDLGFVTLLTQLDDWEVLGETTTQFAEIFQINSSDLL